MTEFQEQVITSLATLTTKVEALQEDVAQVRAYQREQNGRVFSLSDEVVEIKTQLAVADGRSNMALRRLEQKHFLTTISGQTFSGDLYVSYSLLEAGEKWLFDNQHLLELRMDPAEAKARALAQSEGETDIPF